MSQSQKDSPRDLELKANVKRAITTSFIGAISEFEKAFGYIWGHNKQELTENQQKFLELWKQIRNNIMNVGNEQCRIMDREFEKFDVKYVGRYYQFKVKPRNGNRREE